MPEDVGFADEAAVIRTSGMPLLIFGERVGTIVSATPIEGNRLEIEADMDDVAALDVKWSTSDHYALNEDDAYDSLSPWPMIAGPPLWRGAGDVKIAVVGKFQNGTYRKRRNAWLFALLGLPIGYSLPGGEKNVHGRYYWRRGVPHWIRRHG